MFWNKADHMQASMMPIIQCGARSPFIFIARPEHNQEPAIASIGQALRIPRLTRIAGHPTDYTQLRNETDCPGKPIDYRRTDRPCTATEPRELVMNREIGRALSFRS